MKLILIKRSRCPTVLRNAAADSDKYRHPTVVSELWNMQSGKCCYCEQKIPEEGHAKAVEHFAPKSVFKAQRNHWSNLLLACAQCNGRKAAQFPEMLSINPDEVKLIYVKRPSKKVPALIDPSKKTNPEAHLTYHVDPIADGFLAGQIFSRNGSPRGKATIAVIRLDQTFFHARRREHVMTLVRSYLDVLEASDQDRLKTSLLHFENLIARGGLFSGLAREFARKVELDVKYGLHIPAIA